MGAYYWNSNLVTLEDLTGHLSLKQNVGGGGRTMAINVWWCSGHAISVAPSLTRHRKSPSPGLWCSTQIWGKLEDSEWYSHFCTKDEICHGVGPCHASLCISLLPSYCHSVRTELLTLLLFSHFYRQEMSKALS